MKNTRMTMKIEIKINKIRMREWELPQINNRRENKNKNEMNIKWRKI